MKTQGKDRDVVFLSAVRTPFGTFGGTLKDWSAIDLAAHAAKAAIERSGVTPSDFDHAVFGNALQTSADAIYFARHVALKAGLPVATPALTVNRLCGSGFEAVTQAAQQILLGESRCVLAGGGESMSQAPHVVRGARWGIRLGPAAPLEDLLWESLKDPQCGFSMAETAENLADHYRITRAEVDAYAERSQQLAKRAWDDDVFADEVVAIPVKNPKTKQLEPWRRDEHMRPDTTADGLAKLAPYFKKDGVVTAGNASGICDGAGALVVTSEQFATERGRAPLGRLVGWAVAGVEPKHMGIGPAPAIRWPRPAPASRRTCSTPCASPGSGSASAARASAAGRASRCWWRRTRTGASRSDAPVMARSRCERAIRPNEGKEPWASWRSSAWWPRCTPCRACAS